HRVVGAGGAGDVQAGEAGARGAGRGCGAVVVVAHEAGRGERARGVEGGGERDRHGGAVGLAEGQVAAGGGSGEGDPGGPQGGGRGAEGRVDPGGIHGFDVAAGLGRGED